MSVNTSHRCVKLMFMTRSNIKRSNKFIDTFVKYPISLVFYVLLFSIFNVSRVTFITGHLQKKNDHRKLSKAPNMSLTETCDQVFLPEGGATTSQNSPYISVWPLDHL